MAASDILKLIPTFQATALAEDNLKMVEKSQKKKIKVKDLVGQGMKNIVGINLTSLTADMV